MLLRRLGLSLAAGLMALPGVGFLLAAAYLRLAASFPPAAAAAIVGVALVAVAAILLLAGLGRKRGDEWAPEQVALAALRLVARSVRAAPEKALIAALIAGVVSEWLGDGRKRKE
jgi:Putative Actinobacterial Holin-X, holin superfamily III